MQWIHIMSLKQQCLFVRFIRQNIFCASKWVFWPHFFRFKTGQSVYIFPNPSSGTIINSFSGVLFKSTMGWWGLYPSLWVSIGWAVILLIVVVVLGSENYSRERQCISGILAEKEGCHCQADRCRSANSDDGHDTAWVTWAPGFARFLCQ